jgi:D-alanyl-D-alanine carboxypeptidase (penicillin-binding protein 5/6)
VKFINNIKNKSIAVLLCTAMLFTVSGCSKQQVNIPDSYQINSDIFGLLQEESEEIIGNHLMGSEICVANDNIELADVDMSLAESALIFDITNRETIYAKNVHTQLYPASTTKILTAYLALKYGNLDDIVTISSENVKLEKDSSNCGLKAGDQISVKDLLYGLMLKSANEAANALADYISGSTVSFAILMNEEAEALGATNSHFVNAHGLHDDDHYTTAYDLYLIFQNALKNETFREICGSTSYNVSYKNAKGETVSDKWENTMQYFTRNKIAPEGVTVMAGKTGTTSKAQSCLVLLSENEMGEEFISIILKSQDRGVLYDEMNDLLEEINK